MRWTVACALILTMCVCPARAASAQSPCVSLVVADGLDASWSQAVEDLRRELLRPSSIDCVPMTLSVAPAPNGARLDVVSEDGRRAERFVAHEASLVPVALGLVTPIPHEDSVASPRVATPPPETAVVSPPAAGATASPAASTPPQWPRAIALWTGLSAGLRFTAPTSATVLDLEARADVVVRSWLILLSIRSALLSCIGQQGLDCDVYTDVSLGVGVGRRFVAGGPSIDLALAPSIVVMNMEYDYGLEDTAIRDTQVVLRIDASARLSVPLARGWALTITLDGGVAPSLVASPARLSVPAAAAGAVGALPPAFPAWAGGLRLGASAALL